MGSRSTAAVSGPSSSDPAPQTPILGIFGYYGDDQLMNAKNLHRLKAAVTRAIRNQLSLDPSDIVYAANGSSWANHLPVLLHKTHSPTDPKKLVLLLPASLDSSGRFRGNPSAQALNASHWYTKNRLGGVSLVTDLLEAKQAGSTLQVFSGFRARDAAFSRLCTHLLHVTLDRWDETYATSLFRRFDGPKAQLVIKDVL